VPQLRPDCGGANCGGTDCGGANCGGTVCGGAGGCTSTGGTSCNSTSSTRGTRTRAGTRGGAPLGRRHFIAEQSTLDIDVRKRPSESLARHNRGPVCGAPAHAAHAQYLSHRGDHAAHGTRFFGSADQKSERTCGAHIGQNALAPGVRCVQFRARKVIHRNRRPHPRAAGSQPRATGLPAVRCCFRRMPLQKLPPLPACAALRCCRCHRLCGRASTAAASLRPRWHAGSRRVAPSRRTAFCARSATRASLRDGTWLLSELVRLTCGLQRAFAWPLLESQRAAATCGLAQPQRARDSDLSLQRTSRTKCKWLCGVGGASPTSAKESAEIRPTSSSACIMRLMRACGRCERHATRSSESHREGARVPRRTHRLELRLALVRHLKRGQG
jgi:hypothetical protein